MFCEMCDQATHIDCLSPPLQSVPASSWYCDDCIKCNFCSTELAPVNSLQAGYWLDGVERICKNCHDGYVRDGDKCANCKQEVPSGD